LTGYTRNRRFSYRSYIDLFSEEQWWTTLKPNLFMKITKALV